MQQLLRATVFLALLGVVAPTLQLDAATGRLIDVVKPQDQLESFDVYHIPEAVAYDPSRINLADLLKGTSRDEDSAHVSADNLATIALYRSLQYTFFGSEPCEVPHIDIRWAVVLNYRDHAREAIGFNRDVHCVQLLSRSTPTSSTPDLVRFVERTFGFMI